MELNVHSTAQQCNAGQYLSFVALLRRRGIYSWQLMCPLYHMLPLLVFFSITNLRPGAPGLQSATPANLLSEVTLRATIRYCYYCKKILVVSQFEYSFPLRHKDHQVI